MKSTFEYTGINNSVTIEVKAGADLPDPAGKAVKLSGSGAVYPAEGQIPSGIVLISQDADKYETGSDLSIQVKDIGLWKAGADITVGDMLAVNANGACQRAIAGQFMYARALSQGTAGDLITVQIVNAGFEIA